MILQPIEPQTTTGSSLRILYSSLSLSDIPGPSSHLTKSRQKHPGSDINKVLFLYTILRVH